MSKRTQNSRRKLTPEITLIDVRRELSVCTGLVESLSAELATAAKRWETDGRAQLADVLTRLEDRLEMHDGDAPRAGWATTRYAVRAVRRRL